MVQKESLVPIFEKLKNEGIHIVLDTAGTTNIDDVTRKVVDLTDLVMLDVKHLDPMGHKQLTGMTNEKCFAFLNLLKEKKVRTWVRWVIVPGMNDSEEYANRLAEFLKPYDNIELVELLPYHKSGVFKWKELGLTYELMHVKEPSHELAEELASILESAHIKTLYA